MTEEEWRVSCWPVENSPPSEREGGSHRALDGDRLDTRLTCATYSRKAHEWHALLQTGAELLAYASASVPALQLRCHGVGKSAARVNKRTLPSLQIAQPNKNQHRKLMIVGPNYGAMKPEPQLDVSTESLLEYAA